MIQICVLPNFNRDTGDYDVIEPENSTSRVHVVPTYYLLFIQLFQKRLSWSIVDTGTERNFGYSHNE